MVKSTANYKLNAHYISEYEKHKGLPAGLISRTVVETGDQGAWCQLERGELTLQQFVEKFNQECSQRVYTLLN